MRKFAIAIIAGLMMATLIVFAPAAAASPPIACGSHPPERIAKTYIAAPGNRSWTLRCGTGGFGYRHIEGRWTSDPNFDDKIRRTLAYGSVSADRKVYQCNTVLVACNGIIFRVVHENSLYADGRPKGIITAYHN